MKVAAFYENIKEGAKASGITMTEAVKSLMEDGLELLYIGGFSCYEQPDEVNEVLRETGIGVEGLYMFYDFGHHPEDTGYERLIDLCAELGGTNVLLMPGMLPQDSPDRDLQMQNMVVAMTRAVAYGKEKNIAVTMEDCDSLMAPYCSVEGLRYYMDRIPGLQCSFDTGNFMMYEEDEVEAYKLFRDRICTLHLKDRSRTPVNPDDAYKTDTFGSKVYPAPTGYGYIRMETILRDLKAGGFTGNGIVEMYDYSAVNMLKGISDSVKWVRQCWDAE